MRILKRYKDETHTTDTTLAEERASVECCYKDADSLIFIGSEFETPHAYYKVVADHSKVRTID